MNAVSMDLVVSSQSLVGAVCSDRRDNTHTIRIWLLSKSGESVKTKSLSASDAHIIIPVTAKPSCLSIQQFSLAGAESGDMSIVVICAVGATLCRYNLFYSGQEGRVIDTELSECDAEVPIDHITTNASCTLIATFNKLNSRRQGAIVLWSANLKKLRNLEVYSGLGTTSSKVAGLVFTGDNEQYVAVCYSSGFVVGWDAITGEVIFSFSCLSASLTNSPAAPCTFIALPSDPAGLALCIGMEDGCVKYYDLLPSRGSEGKQFDPRERHAIDLRRTLRFAGINSRTEEGVAKELTVIPLSTFLYPAAYLQEQLCIVIPSGVVLLSAKDGKLIQAFSLDQLEVGMITSASCGTTTYADNIDCDEENTPFLHIALHNAFSDNIVVYTHHTQPFTSAATNSSAPPRSTTLPTNKSAVPSYGDIDIGIADISLMNGASEEAITAQRRQDLKQVKGSSVYEDESIPLSYFLHSSMRPNSSDYDDADFTVSTTQRSILFDPPTNTNNNINNVHKSNPTSRTRATSATTAPTNSWEVPKKDKTGKLVDQPITFQRRIKSSGYGQIPQDLYEKKKYFQQQDALKKQRAAAQVLQRSLSANSSGLKNSTNGNNTSSMEGITGPRIRQYPLECAAMSVHQPSNDITPCCTVISTNDVGAQTSGSRAINASAYPIHHISYSGDGSLLGVSSADCAVVVVKLPVNKYGTEAVVSYMGHTSRINNISFSHSRYAYNHCGGAPTATTMTSKNPRSLPQYSQLHYQLLSSSADGTARMWRNGSTDSAAVVFSHVKHSISGTDLSSLNTQKTGMNAAYMGNSKRVAQSGVKSGVNPSTVGNVGVSTYNPGGPNGANNSKIFDAKSARNRPFGDAVSHASYFYMDKFALMSVKSSVYLYRYNVRSEDATDDLKRTLSTGSYQRATHWDLSPLAQNVCALNAMNSAHSPLIFAATTDKYLNVLDASTGGIARVVASPHTRSIHCIALPRPSVHTALSPDAYNCFLTSAKDNNIYLWDLRAPSAVSRFYQAHVNTREHITCDVSPCMRYVATGSEDKAAVIYDIRTGRALSRLTGQRDVVKCVAFNPLFPQLAAGSYDGTVKFYGDPDYYL